jgi:hypothetical protein
MLFNFSYKWISLKIPKMNPSPINIHFSSLSRMINPITLGEMPKQNELERNPNPNLSQETLGIFSTVNNLIKDIEKELDKSAKTISNNTIPVDDIQDDIGINCCVCYTDSTSFQFKTHCNHNLCVECLVQLVQYECPMCRSVFPTSIRTAINSLKNSKKNDDTDDDDYLDNNTTDTNQEPATIPVVYEEGPRPIPSYGFSWSGTPAFY